MHDPGLFVRYKSAFNRLRKRDMSDAVTTHCGRLTIDLEFMTGRFNGGVRFSIEEVWVGGASHFSYQMNNNRHKDTIREAFRDLIPDMKVNKHVEQENGIAMTCLDRIYHWVDPASISFRGLILGD
jgi:hypothetical protein